MMLGFCVWDTVVLVVEVGLAELPLDPVLTYRFISADALRA
jgi:hypothetical protein